MQRGLRQCSSIQRHQQCAVQRKTPRRGKQPDGRREGAPATIRRHTYEESQVCGKDSPVLCGAVASVTSSTQMVSSRVTVALLDLRFGDAAYVTVGRLPVRHHQRAQGYTTSNQEHNHVLQHGYIGSRTRSWLQTSCSDTPNNREPNKYTGNSETINPTAKNTPAPPVGCC